MIDSFHKLYYASRYNFNRIPKTRWISMNYHLSQDCRLSADNHVTLKLATDDDVKKIEKHPEANENIVRSVLKFWHHYGIHSLYLGYFDSDDEPTIMQYVIDHEYNDIYSMMTYGKMYLPHTPESVQVENIYKFKDRQRKNAAKYFEDALFNMLWHKGKRLIRTHIATVNKAALIWASRIGYNPQYWISMITLNLPLLRRMKPSFIFRKIEPHEWNLYPLNLFKTQSDEIKEKHEHRDQVVVGT